MKYTSKELSQWLQENGYSWETNKYWWIDVISEPRLIDKEELDEMYPSMGGTHLPAYDIANDLLIKHAKELFGEASGFRECNEECAFHHGLIPTRFGHWHLTGQPCTIEVFTLLQQGKQEEAENYIIEHSIKKV